MNSQKITPGQFIHGFELQRVEAIPELRSEAAVFVHQKTGARLLHLFNEDPNNLFCIAFRTPVYNDTGVPHILEHSVLSGSRRFPVKDPFKEMLKGSMQTFLNAMTYPDKTIYPVSSQVEADYFNLMDVYCDAVFNPLLTQTTFCQEGWHFDTDDPDGPVNIRGIVYNEMKGVFSDFRSHVARKTLSELFPNTTYFFESGGEPEHITDLTYEEFKGFHDQFYHPSNSFIFLYGNLPSEKSLKFLNERYLREFSYRDVDSVIRPQPLWEMPKKATLIAPASKQDDHTASVIISWIMGETVDPQLWLLGSILSRYLVGAESSPLKRALIDSGLGEDLDDMTGFDADLVQCMFAVGLRKTRPGHADTIRKIVFETIEKEVDRGMDEQLLEGVIRQAEFRLREITDSGHFPHNLMLAERCYRSWIYEGDPLSHLKFEAPLDEIKAHKRQGTQFFVNTLKELFLNNNHHLVCTVIASAEEGQKLEKQTEEQVHRLTESFTQEDRKNAYELTKKIREQQMQPPAPEELSKLPKLKKEEVPRENQLVETLRSEIGSVPFFAHPLFTANIVYLDFGFDLTTVPLDLLPYMSLYAEMLTRCGAGDYSYEQMATRVSLNTGGIGSSIVCTTKVGNPDEILLKGIFQGKALVERFENMLAIFEDLFTRPRLEDPKLVKDTLVEMRNDLNAAVLRSGHSFASMHAAARLSRSRYIDEMLDGISQLRFLDALVRKNDMDTVVGSLKRLHDIIINHQGCFLSVTADDPESFKPSLSRFLEKLPRVEVNPQTIPFEPRLDFPNHAIEVSSSVNYVSQAWRLDITDAAEIGQFLLMSRNLSTGYLWEKVRVEGGAYGGMALASSSHPVFACASYRDPNLSSTLKHFLDGLGGLAKKIAADELDQSIIGTIGRMDSPRSPHAKGLGETLALLSERTPEYRQAVRDAILHATPESIAMKATQILDEHRTTVSIIGSAAAFDKAEKEGLQLYREQLLQEE